MEALLFKGVQEFWSTLLEMSPYLLFGFAVAGLLSVLVTPEQVERHLGKRGLLSIVKASFFGIPLPLCSCGVIPVAASLRRHGAGKGAVASFLLSTPQTGVDSIMVTYSLLGPLFAVFRPLAALVSGVIGGVLVELADSGDDSSVPEECVDECCLPAKHGRHPVLRALQYGFVTLPKDIGKSMLAGLGIAGIIAALVPDNFFTDNIGAGLPGMFFMMLVGIPVYVCATASVPIALAMMLKGISPGAALVFLITGPATNAAAIASLWRILGRRSALIYMFAVAFVAIASGLALDYLFGVVSLGSGHVAHNMLPSWVNLVSGAVLLPVLAQSFLKSRHKPAPSVGERQFKVKGMTCSHCKAELEKVMRKVEGVDEAVVSLDNGCLTVRGNATGEVIAAAVESAGYSVIQDTGEQANEIQRKRA